MMKNSTWTHSHRDPRKVVIFAGRQLASQRSHVAVCSMADTLHALHRQRRAIVRLRSVVDQQDEVPMTFTKVKVAARSILSAFDAI